MLVNDVLVDYLVETASELGVVAPFEYSRIRTAVGPGSVCGEKTEKGIIEKVGRNVFVNNKVDYRVLDIHDLIRATVVVNEYEHIPEVLDMLKKTFPDLTGKQVYNQERGYRATHIKTADVDGVGADLHIETPEMAMVNAIHHKLYENIRKAPHGSAEREKLVKIGRDLYDTFWEYIFAETEAEKTNGQLASMFTSYGDIAARNDIDRFPKDLVKTLRKPPFVIKQGIMICSSGELRNQAKQAHEFVIGPQAKLNKLLYGVFGKYSSEVAVNKN